MRYCNPHWNHLSVVTTYVGDTMWSKSYCLSGGVLHRRRPRIVYWGYLR